jgi:phosphate-selective porin OprO/OprP
MIQPLLNERDIVAGRGQIKGLFVGAFLFAGALAYGAEDTHIVAAAQADEDAAWESVFVASNQIPFHINLYMKGGLYYEVVEDSTYNGTIYRSVFSEKRRLTGRLGAKVFVDGALYKQDGNLPASDGFAVRKFRVNTYGRGFFLSPLTFGVEFGLANGKFFLNDGYVWFHEVPFIRSVKFGIFTSPMSMESLQSSSTLSMLEQSAPVTAFAPGDKLGVQLGGDLFGGRGTLHGGLFSDVVGTENADAVESAYRAMVRATWLPVVAPTTNGMPRLIHLGASASYMHFAGDGVQFRARPESFLAPYLIDTGKLQGSRSNIAALEAATQTGPMLLRGELFYVDADDALADRHGFYGGYVNAALMLTGETRPYNRNTGNFSGITPFRKFSFKNQTWGALEWASRLSYTDLSDGSIAGGRMGVFSTGINCYLTPRNRFMFAVGAADVRESPAAGTLYFVQSRFQVEF